LNRRSLGPALLLAALSTNPAASDSVEVAVRVSIAPVCRFTGTPGLALTLSNTGAGGDIDPRLSAPATGTIDLGYRCTYGTAPRFVVPPTATLSCSACSVPSSMDAALSYTSGGQGLGMNEAGNRTFSLTGQVAPATYQAAPAGAYLGNVTVTVAP
jgi:hypothetical protein